jgi:recombination protein RecA
LTRIIRQDDAYAHGDRLVKSAAARRLIDVEHALDPAYAKRLGVDLDDLLVSQPVLWRRGARICETLVRSNAPDVIVIDSVAALTARNWKARSAT